MAFDGALLFDSADLVSILGVSWVFWAVLCLRAQELFDSVPDRDPRTSVTSDSVSHRCQGTACLGLPQPA
jgi:hypothetical protein